MNIIYTLPQLSGNSNFVSSYTTEAINGNIAKVYSFSNFTGSIMLFQSGNSLPFINLSTTSGTSKYESFPFSNTTGSFYVNEPLQIAISGLTSGTSVKAGPITIYYN